MNNLALIDQRRIPLQTQTNSSKGPRTTWLPNSCMTIINMTLKWTCEHWAFWYTKWSSGSQLSMMTLKSWFLEGFYIETSMNGSTWKASSKSLSSISSRNSYKLTLNDDQTYKKSKNLNFSKASSGIKYLRSNLLSSLSWSTTPSTLTKASSLQMLTLNARALKTIPNNSSLQFLNFLKSRSCRIYPNQKTPFIQGWRTKGKKWPSSCSSSFQMKGSRTYTAPKFMMKISWNLSYRASADKKKMREKFWMRIFLIWTAQIETVLRILMTKSLKSWRTPNLICLYPEAKTPHVNPK